MKPEYVCELKKPSEMYAMTHAQLLDYAMSLHLEVDVLRHRLESTTGFLEIAARSKDEAQH